MFSNVEEKKERFAVLTVASSLTREMCVFRINREEEKKAPKTFLIYVPSGFAVRY